MTGSAAWATPRALRELERLWAAGVSTAEIGQALGVSKNSIVGKAHRLGLPERPTPIKGRANWIDRAGVVERLSVLWRSETVLLSDIAREFGVTPDAVTSKAKRLKLGERPRPVPTSVSLRFASRGDIKPAPKPKPAPVRPEPVIARQPVEALVPNTDGRTCCWPTGQAKVVFTCDQPAVGRMPYCLEHAFNSYPNLKERIAAARQQQDAAGISHE